MTMLRNRLVAFSIAVGGLASVLASAAWAQGYPSKPVRVLIGTSAGSNPDTFGRLFANSLSQVLGQQVIVENRAGAGGNIGGELAARAPADGYTIFLPHTNYTINHAVYRKLNYDIIADFAPVTMLTQSPFVLSVHPSLPVRSVRELLSLARARPGDLNYASAGTGSGTFFATEYFKALANINLVQVPYNGGGPALASVVAGETSVYFTPLAVGLPHFASGRLRPLGVTSPKRLAHVPDIPPVAESVPGYEMMAWSGLLVPVRTPREIVDTLHKAALAAMAKPEMTRRLDDLGFIVMTGRPDEMHTFLKSEMAKYAKLIREIGMPLQ
ncbi:MAG TPA: tripartite tricarboxylate transporter substrate binding protein [Burkholderiales bacterium]|nr:tripartite tricarboxylate transporter substrate binding protein [Burkholderiales bacterium]